MIDCHDRELVGYEFARRGRAKEAERALEAACIERFGTLRPDGTTPVLRSDNGLTPDQHSVLALLDWLHDAAEADPARVTDLLAQPRLRRRGSSTSGRRQDASPARWGPRQ